MLELYQTEWCPHSHTVRQRMTELGIDFVARQVDAEPEDRDALRHLAGSDKIPVLVTDDGGIVSGEDEILAYLEKHAGDEPDAPEHREKSAAKVSDFSA